MSRFPIMSRIRSLCSTAAQSFPTNLKDVYDVAKQAQRKADAAIPWSSAITLGGVTAAVTVFGVQSQLGTKLDAVKNDMALMRSQTKSSLDAMQSQIGSMQTQIGSSIDGMKLMQNYIGSSIDGMNSRITHMEKCTQRTDQAVTELTGDMKQVKATVNELAQGVEPRNPSNTGA